MIRMSLSHYSSCINSKCNFIAALLLLFLSLLFGSSVALAGTICAQDAQRCPDGTFVNRIAPRCEFAWCPDVSGAPDAAIFGRDLFWGIRASRDVRALQKFLAGQGVFHGDATGNFFSLTRDAVKKFQAARGIVATGYFGPLSRAAVNKIIAAQKIAVSPETSGFLTIDPRLIVVPVGEWTRMRAVFSPPRPACLNFVPACKVPEQAPYEVDGGFISDNPSIAAVDIIIPDCAAPPVGITEPAPCSRPGYVIRGISPGQTVLTARYTDTGGTFGASTTVTVSPALPPSGY